MISLAGERLFHINRQANRSPYPLLQPGGVITIGSTTNPFFRFFDADGRTFPVTEANGTVNMVPALRFLGEVRDGTINPDDLPGDAYVIAEHFMMLARELLWESVRLAEFPAEPSRQRSVWLIESMADVKRWLTAMKFRPVQVVEVKATGRALVTDQSHLAGDSEILSIWYEKARAYWRGERSQDPLLETMFEGTIEVMRIVDPRDYQGS
jgi:uncharacterized protein DUF2441